MNTRTLILAAACAAGTLVSGFAWAQPAPLPLQPAEPTPPPPEAALPAPSPDVAPNSNELAPSPEPSEPISPPPPQVQPNPPDLSQTLPLPEPPKPPRRARPHPYQIQVGIRTSIFPHEGFDPYSEGNGMPAAAFSFAYTPWRSLPFSVYGVGEWSIGGVGPNDVRTAESSLVMNRLGLGLEGRYEPISRLYMFVKLMPTAMNLSGSIDAQGLYPRLTGDDWTWGFDATAGTAIRIGNIGRDESPKSTFWISLDLGYGFAGEAKVVLRPTGDDDALEGRRFGGIPLTPFRPSGVLWRVAMSLAF